MFGLADSPREACEFGALRDNTRYFPFHVAALVPTIEPCTDASMVVDPVGGHVFGSQPGHTFDIGRAMPKHGRSEPRSDVRPRSSSQREGRIPRVVPRSQ